MSAPEKPTELIFLPEPSWLPAIAAAAVAGLVIGLYSWFPYAIVGGVVAVIVLIAWIRRTGSDINRMPREQDTDTAPVPLTGAAPRD